jgi:hypothetical protein
MPRRRIVHDPAVIFVKVEAVEHRALRRHAEVRNVSMSDLVRDMVHRYLVGVGEVTRDKR